MNRSTKFLALVVASTLLAGCHLFGKDEPAIDRWGGLLSELRYQWSAEPGIDILTGAAVPVRAYFESRMLAQSMGNLDYAYPGFTRAVPEDPPNTDRPLRPNVDHRLSKAPIGNSHHHILSLDRAGDTASATVCVYNYAVATAANDTEFESVASGSQEPAGIRAERVLLSAPADESWGLPPQAGPSPAPSGDVFGDWRITGYLVTPSQPGFAAQWPSYAADLAECVATAPDPADRRAFLVSGPHPRAAFPTSPAQPGWPEDGGAT